MNKTNGGMYPQKEAIASSRQLIQRQWAIVVTVFKQEGGSVGRLLYVQYNVSMRLTRQKMIHACNT